MERREGEERMRKGGLLVGQMLGQNKLSGAGSSGKVRMQIANGFVGNVALLGLEGDADAKRWVS